MQKDCKIINNVKTSLLLWGNPYDVHGKDVVLCFTGNPGICDFYIEFATTIHKKTSMPVCVINLAGHEPVSDKIPNILKTREHLYNLDGQLKHKSEFIRDYIHKSNKLHLVGHSIGAWIIVELIDKNVELLQKVSSVNLLFPTIQRMAQSKNGWYMNNILRKTYKIILFLCALLYLLPEFICKFLIEVYLACKSIPSVHSDAIYKLINPNVLEKVFFLAFNEMDTVTKLNYIGLDKIKHLTNVIYGVQDNWAPVEYMKDLKVFEPQLQLQEVDISHAFVLTSSSNVAYMVSEFIKQKSTSTVN